MKIRSEGLIFLFAKGKSGRVLGMETGNLDPVSLFFFFFVISVSMIMTDL